MVSFRRYVSSWPREFRLVLFQKRNEINFKNLHENKKQNQKEQNKNIEKQNKNNKRKSSKNTTKKEMLFQGL